MTAIDIVVTVAGAIGFGFALVRWLRVAEREHYHSGCATRFARRWWGSTNPNVALVCAAVFTGALVVRVADHGSGHGRGRGDRAVRSRVEGSHEQAGLDPTAADRGDRHCPAHDRRRRRSSVCCSIAAPRAVAVSGLAAPLLVDGALWLVAPLERALARRHITRATATLRRISPTVVAITGSYGKTTTKQYVRHLISGSRRVVATPASFNNAAGLSRAITEQLAPGTEVFIAEMGTYGKGEISSLCEWVKPQIGVVTAIGPVHLERMRSLDTIVAAKSEILECVGTAVLNVDAYGLAAVADANRLAGKRVIACSGERLTSPVDVRVLREDGRLTIDAGESCTASLNHAAQPSNLAVRSRSPWPSTCRGTRS